MAGIPLDLPWQDLLREASRSPDLLPKRVKAELVKITKRMCDLGEKHQIPPRVMASVIAGIIGNLAMAETNGNVHDDATFDEFIELCHVAIHVAVAKTRIAGGWTPEGPN